MMRLNDEEKNLEYLLKENYNKLTNDSENCIQKVLNYILDIEDVREKDINFVKKLTKVADHAAKLNHLVAHNFAFNEKLYRFNLWEGVTGEFNPPTTKEHVLRVKAHFRAYAGNAAGRLSSLEGPRKWTHWLNWLKRQYGCYRRSAELTTEAEPKHSLFAYFKAAETAEKMYKIIEKYRAGDTLALVWAGRSCDAALLSAQAAYHHWFFAHAVHAYSFIADTSYFIYSKTNNINFEKLRKTCWERVSLCHKMEHEKNVVLLEMF